MSGYSGIQFCPHCGHESLRVEVMRDRITQQCDLCGFRLLPQVPSQTHVGNAKAFVAAARDWFQIKQLKIPSDLQLADAVEYGAEDMLEFIDGGGEFFSAEKHNQFARQFQSLIDEFYAYETKESEFLLVNAADGNDRTPLIAQTADQAKGEALELLGWEIKQIKKKARQ